MPILAYDRLQFRSRYQDRDGKSISVWSVPGEPPLEVFDQAFQAPSEAEYQVMLQYFRDIQTRPSRAKKATYHKHDPNQASWQLQGD